MIKTHFKQVRQLIDCYHSMGATKFQLFLASLYLPLMPFFVRQELSYVIKPSKTVDELIALFKG